MIRYKIIAFLSLIFSCNTLAQTLDYSGPISSSLAYMKVFDDSPWAALSNAANLAYSENLATGIGYQMRFNMSELSSRTGVMVLPSSYGTFAGLIYQSGYSKSNYNRYALSYSRAFGNKISAGLQFNYLTHQIEGADRADAFYTSLGIGYYISESFELGVFIQNPEQSKMNYGGYDYSLLTYFNTAVKYTATDNVLIIAELEKEQEQTLVFKTGCQIDFNNRLAVRAGIKGQPLELTVGGGFKHSGLTIDVGFAHHPQLGLTSGAGLYYSFNRK